MVCYLNSRMAQMPPMFDENKQLDKSELVDSLSDKAPRNHKAMLISKGFNPETGNLATFMEHCERAETMDNIAVDTFLASDKDSDTKRNKIVPSLRNARKTERNLIRKTPHFIALSMVKISGTPIGIAKSSRQELKIKIILNIQLSITIGSP